MEEDEKPSELVLVALLDANADVTSLLEIPELWGAVLDAWVAEVEGPEVRVDGSIMLVAYEELRGLVLGLLDDEPDCTLVPDRLKTVDVWLAELGTELVDPKVGSVDANWEESILDVSVPELYDPEVTTVNVDCIDAELSSEVSEDSEVSCVDEEPPEGTLENTAAEVDDANDCCDDVDWAAEDGETRAVVEESKVDDCSEVGADDPSKLVD